MTSYDHPRQSTLGLNRHETSSSGLPVLTPAIRLSLGLGAAAGPIFTVVGLTQALTRKGYEFDHHTLSLLSNGPHGWIQVTNFIVVGLFYLVAASAMAALAGWVKTPDRVTPRLLAIFALGMIAAGVFKPDAALGFPPGTPQGPAEVMTVAGSLHYGLSSLGFLALVAAMLVHSRRAVRTGHVAAAVVPAAIAVAVLAGLGLAMSGSTAPFTTVLFVVAALAAFLWASAVSALVQATHNRAS